MNKNYVSGRAKEYRIRNKFIKEGYDVVARTAGSHSKIDVFAINRKEKKIVLIQSKPKSMSNNKKKKLEEELKWLNDNFHVRFEVR